VTKGKDLFGRPVIFIYAGKHNKYKRSLEELKVINIDDGWIDAVIIALLSENKRYHVAVDVIQMMKQYILIIYTMMMML
jgi:hypothetical protein